MGELRIYDFIMNIRLIKGIRYFIKDVSKHTRKSIIVLLVAYLAYSLLLYFVVSDSLTMSLIMFMVSFATALVLGVWVILDEGEKDVLTSINISMIYVFINILVLTFPFAAQPLMMALGSQEFFATLFPDLAALMGNYSRIDRQSVFNIYILAYVGILVGAATGGLFGAIYNNLKTTDSKKSDGDVVERRKNN